MLLTTTPSLGFYNVGEDTNNRVTKHLLQVLILLFYHETNYKLVCASIDYNYLACNELHPRMNGGDSCEHLVSIRKDNNFIILVFNLVIPTILLGLLKIKHSASLVLDISY